MIIWFTGQPGSGKTTLAEKVADHIGGLLIDGDDLRRVFGTQYGKKPVTVDKDGRWANVALAQQIAKFYHGVGGHAVVAMVSPYREQRRLFKEDIGAHFLEVYVHTSKKRGKEHFFAADYEAPWNTPHLDLDTGKKSIQECLDTILAVVDEDI